MRMIGVGDGDRSLGSGGGTRVVILLGGRERGGGSG